MQPLSRLIGSPAIAVLLGVLAACGGGDPPPAPRPEPRPTPGPTFAAEIRRTAFGIPHILARDEAGLGYGVGHAYAQDNLCVVAEKFMSLRGERSRHYGPGEPDAAAPEGAHLASDYAHRLIGDDASVQAYQRAQTPEVQALHAGWVAGYNRYLRDTPRLKLPDACRDAAWLRPIEPADLARLMRYYTTLMGLSGWAVALSAAQPPAPQSSLPVAGPPATVNRRERALMRLTQRRAPASNSIAFGRDTSANGRGLLLGNPHFPWTGVERLYQLHLTLPGKLDVMGASLPGMAVVGLGFTHEFAWSHTASKAAHATFYQLELDPADPTRYVVDGISKPMARRRLTLDVLGPDGRLRPQSRVFYSTEFGPVVVSPDLFEWTPTTAYALRDTNAHNHWMVAQWHALNRAASLAEVKAAHQSLVGNPWNNTLAADRHGRTLFLDVSPVPQLSAAKVSRCQLASHADMAVYGLWVLSGNRSDCHWDDVPGAVHPGTVPGPQLPVLERDDYVHNANNSAWMTQPAAPLTGYSPVVSLQDVPLGRRTRMGLRQIEDRLSGRDGLPGRRVSLQQLQDFVMGNRVHLADLVLDDLLALCRPGHPLHDDADSPCPALCAWDRTANLDAGIGYGYLEALLPYLDEHPEVWRVPFDPRDPVYTPRGLDLRTPLVEAGLVAALRAAVQSVHASGWQPGMRWGEVQGVTRGRERIPIHGGDEGLGVYNSVYSTPSGPGQREVYDGTSYVQAVAFDADGPHAEALLSYSQSTDPASPHFADQTRRFSRKAWLRLPFTEAEIRADPGYRRLRIEE
ncbi:penicillin acylase family protein [Caldimonas brevitalea]|uniref:Acyl-homoserine lactone acylase PvdQ n=1 Tax=Caldimonas brevitalea TaxID=413882 RepID=A0A0G3BFF0_9BURK|nr:penicillin acylase family protein [Caldimonas brevitalea]AKJ26698.1 acyl-homoserine lactone acylase PvdQ [Caldimonas brevitalea]